MTNYDYYSMTRNLISRLEAEGHTLEASNLLTAMEEGATGTEILMALRFHLSDIVQHLNLALEDETKTKAIELLTEINNALK